MAEVTLNGLTARRAQRGDLPRLLELLADDELGKNREGGVGSDDPAYSRAFDVIDRDPNQQLLVAELDGRVVGMPGEGVETFGIRGDEMFDVEFEEELRPQMPVTLIVFGKDGEKQIPLKLRIDTPIEVEYYRHGGILPYVLRQLLAA